MKKSHKKKSSAPSSWKGEQNHLPMEGSEGKSVLSRSSEATLPKKSVDSFWYYFSLLMILGSTLVALLLWGWTVLAVVCLAVLAFFIWVSFQSGSLIRQHLGATKLNWGAAVRYFEQLVERQHGVRPRLWTHPTTLPVILSWGRDEFDQNILISYGALSVLGEEELEGLFLVHLARQKSRDLGRRTWRAALALVLLKKSVLFTPVVRRLVWGGGHPEQGCWDDGDRASFGHALDWGVNPRILDQALRKSTSLSSLGVVEEVALRPLASVSYPDWTRGQLPWPLWWMPSSTNS